MLTPTRQDVYCHQQYLLLYDEKTRKVASWIFIFTLDRQKGSSSGVASGPGVDRCTKYAALYQEDSKKEPTQGHAYRLYVQLSGSLMPSAEDVACIFLSSFWLFGDATILYAVAQVMTASNLVRGKIGREVTAGECALYVCA